MLKIKDCVRCSGATVPDYEGRICINCGHADYTVNMGNVLKDKKEIDPNLKLINTFTIRRKGKGDRAWAPHEATVHIMSKMDGRAKESFRFDMICPYTGCGERKNPKKYAKRKGIYTEYRYSCTVGHLWYLLVHKQEPVYWRY
tara:strand:- start:205 stop:633 length:429 start_codon:yes stop_codon:yes gene_type:complete